MQFIKQIRDLTILSMTLMALLIPLNAYSQEMMGGNMSCPLCGFMGWGGMILGGGLMLAFIAALVSLTVYLLRRSRNLSQ